MIIYDCWTDASNHSRKPAIHQAGQAPTFTKLCADGIVFNPGILVLFFHFSITYVSAARLSHLVRTQFNK